MKKAYLTISWVLLLMQCAKTEDAATTGSTTTTATTLSVSATSPADASTNSMITTTIAVTFSQAMQTGTLTASTTTACTSSIQVSLDNFANCIAMTSATPTFSGGNTIATITPAASLTANQQYKIRVTTGAQTTGGLALSSAYTSPTGFTTGYTLSVSKTGTGAANGTVTSNVGGISCGSTCAAGFANNTVVTLTASVPGGSTFAGWSGGGCSGTGTCVSTMTSARSITASFTTP